MNHSLGPSAQRELDQLLAMLEYDRKEGWLDPAADDQHRALALTYLMQHLGARHVRELRATAHPHVYKETPGYSSQASVWVYGLEVHDGEVVRFVGVHGETSREAAAKAAVLRKHPDATDWPAKHWEFGQNAFKSLEDARSMYFKESYAALGKAVGLGAAYLQSLEMDTPAVQGNPPPKARL